MKERPILFNSEMVRAILEGRKTQTRRILKTQPSENTNRIVPLYQCEPVPKVTEVSFHEVLENGIPHCSPISRCKCPFGKIGDRLWVRESFGTKIRNLGGTPHESFTYKADNPNEINFYDCNGNGFPVKWTPSIHMPRSACRLVLEIINIRVEPLFYITNQEAISEGIEQIRIHSDGTPVFKDYGFKERSTGTTSGFGYPVNSFQSLWESVYGSDSWKQNPWVWVVEFKVIQGGES